jgi:twinkle protein
MIRTSRIRVFRSVVVEQHQCRYRKRPSYSSSSPFNTCSNRTTIQQYQSTIPVVLALSSPQQEYFQQSRQFSSVSPVLSLHCDDNDDVSNDSINSRVSLPQQYATKTPASVASQFSVSTNMTYCSLITNSMSATTERNDSSLNGSNRQRNYHSATSSTHLLRLQQSVVIPFLLPADDSIHHQEQNHQCCQTRTKSVFVSRHNQSMNITSNVIIELLQSNAIINSLAGVRTTASHVIVKECPFCSKPTGGKLDNEFKLYIQTGSGVYMCHRCGANGSWYDLKLRLSGNSADNNNSSGQSSSLHAAIASLDGSTSSNSYNTSRGGGGGTSTGQFGGSGSNDKYDGISLSKYTTNKNENDKFQGYLNRKPTIHPTAPLPMPPYRLAAIYSTHLLDSANTKKETTADSNVLDYLLDERGLDIQTLRKYGVGKAIYKFPRNDTWVDSECVSFPWILNVCDLEYQEELRGSNFEWDASKYQSSTIPSVNDNDEKEHSNDDGNGNVKEGQEKIQKCQNDKNDNGDIDKEEPVKKRGRPRKRRTNNDVDTRNAEAEMLKLKQSTYLTRRIKVRSIENKAWQRMDPAGGGWGLFGYHTIPIGSKEVIITEGEYDAMAVYQATNRPAISLPNGCRSLPVEVLPLLEEFDKIILWMDNDAPGREGAELFAKKIGLERCYLVRPTKDNCRYLPLESDDTDVGTTGSKNKNNKYDNDDNDTDYDDIPIPKDANEALLDGLDLNRIIDDAKLIPHERITDFAGLRADVLHEIMYPERISGIPVPSLPGLTNIIKGLRRGEVTVLTGPTGSGKTTYLGQMSLDLAEQDVNVLWGSFEIKNTRLLHKLLQQYAREPITAGDPTKFEKLETLADRFQSLPIQFMKFHGGSDVDDVIDAMDYAVYVYDVEHIILDNMQFMISRQNLSRGGMRHNQFDKFEVQDIAIEKFRKFATDRNVHITVVVHPRKEQEHSYLSMSSIYGSAKATQEADLVMILQNDGKHKYLEVKKNRFNGSLGHIPLFYDTKSGRYSEEPQIDGLISKPALSLQNKPQTIREQQKENITSRPRDNDDDDEDGLFFTN